MDGKSTYRFNDKDERYHVMNRLYLLAAEALMAIVLLYSVVKLMLKGISTYGAIAAIVLIIVSCIMNTFIFLGNKSSSNLKLAITLEMGILFLMTSIMCNAQFSNIMLIAVLAVQVPYYDKKRFLCNVVFYVILYIATLVIGALNGVYALDLGVFCTAGVMMGTFYVLVRIETISKAFSDHALGAVEEQSDQQKSMIENIVAISRNVKDESDKSTDLVNNLVSATETVTGSMQEISSATSLTARNIEEQSGMTQNIQEAIEKTGENSKRMVGIATESNESIQENMKVMERLEEQSVQIANTNNEVTSSMERLQHKTKEVEAIAGMILNISSQTNLLALNASIESARAGEAGRGFAVVAEQIRQLAEQTKSSTEEITRIITELNENANEVVESVAESVSATTSQNEMIHSAAEAFGKLNTNMVELISNIDEIDSRIMNLSDSNNKLVENITQLSATTEEVTASAEQASELSIQNLNYAQGAKDSIHHIQETAEGLEQYI